METGTVREWHSEDGWGVIDSPVTPGGCWAHYSVIEADGYRDLDPDDTVSFTFEAPGQDGYPFSATQIWPSGVEPGTSVRRASPGGRAYQSTLTITLDDGTVMVDDDAHDFLRKARKPTEEES